MQRIKKTAMSGLFERESAKELCLIVCDNHKGYRTVQDAGKYPG